MSNEKALTVGELIEQLKKMDATHPVSVHVKPYNKVAGEFLPVRNTPTSYGTLQWVEQTVHGGIRITVFLPEGKSITTRAK